MQASCIDCLLSLWRSSGGNKSIGFTVGPGEGDGDALAVTTQSDKIPWSGDRDGNPDPEQRERGQREVDGTARDAWGQREVHGDRESGDRESGD